MADKETWMFGMNDVKRFFQWSLGCTYAKKSIRTRISEMFHFAEAPHIVVYEQSQESPWWWTVGIITAVLIGVLSLYYTLEAIIRAIRKFFVNLFREPQSTVSTPRCLSPVKSSTKIISPETPKTPNNTVRQKVLMNEPVNCVFIRPANLKPPNDSPKILVPTLNSEEDQIDQPEPMPDPPKKEKKKSPQQPPLRLEDAEFTAGSNLNIRPTLVPSPKICNAQPPRKMSGSDAPPLDADSSRSVSSQMNEWVEKQMLGLSQQEDRSNAGGVCEAPLEVPEPSETLPADMMDHIHQLVQSLFNTNNVVVAGAETSNENVSEMSSVPPTETVSLKTIFSEVSSAASPVLNTGMDLSRFGRETTASEEDADIILDDNSILAETENECSGSILVANGAQKVLFRWTDDEPMSVDSVTVTGSFFDWNMNLPMRRTGDNTFEICVELPPGMHDYMIRIFRFE